jgi:hypothetical protein
MLHFQHPPLYRLEIRCCIDRLKPQPIPDIIAVHDLISDVIRIIQN